MEKKENKEEFLVYLIRAKSGEFIFAGANFCCRGMGSRFESDVDTGVSVFGKPALSPTWKLRGMEIFFCPFCGREIKYDIKEESQLVVASGQNADKLKK